MGLRSGVTLEDLNSFGDVAAEDDAVLEYFVATKAVEKIESGDAFLVLGRKGTGKTAIVRYFTEKQEGNRARALSLKGYPWNVHAARVDFGASNVEAYVSSWRYLIAVELAALTLKQPHAWRCEDTKPLTQFLNDNYGGVDPALSDVLRPARLELGKLSLAPSIMGNALGGIDLERSKKDFQFGVELNALSSSIIDACHNVLRECGAGPISLHFDELDQGITSLDEERTRMLIGLVLAARDLKRESQSAGVAINPVVYLRSDLWEELQFSDKNKISQTLTLPLEWDSDSLAAMVSYRLRAKLDAEATWDDIAEPELMRGSQAKWSHILARTFLRPRDVISFLNSALAAYKSRPERGPALSNLDIVSSRDRYSNYLKLELDDEIGPHWPQWTEALQACSAISTITFERDDFEREYDNRRSPVNKVSSDEALNYLYRFSAIGYRGGIGYGGSSWNFQYSDPEAGWDSAARNFKVHPGLKEYARLREVRAT
ncbi:MAG TPA: hypothetical protein VGN80_18945 [Devosiaceae bacterium]|jgi:hypothetical protein|nr:hypothetical protein [Devosiaceae bacterium]